MLPLDDALRRRVSWTVFVLACAAYVLLGVAEEGARGSYLQAPPDAPLPFRRDRVYGLDLQGRSTLQALEWLNQAGNPNLALTIVPIDADVVAALGREDGRPAAFAALDALVLAANGSPLAACLHEPPDTTAGLAVAQAAVGALTQRFPTAFVYAFACGADSDAQWRRDVARAVIEDEEQPLPAGPSLIPVSAGQTVSLAEASQDDVRRDELLPAPGGTYAVYQIPLESAPESGFTEDAARTLRNTAHAALIAARPGGSADPAAFAAAIGEVFIGGGELPEGFTAVQSPFVTTGAGWEAVAVGTIPYARAAAAEATMQFQFVGTDVYLLGLVSPEGGTVDVWIDPPPDISASTPDTTLDLAALQAQDAALPVAFGLSAARHRLLLRASGDAGTTVVVSGFFVTGRPAPAWAGALASLVLLSIASLALAERALSSIRSIRQRLGPARRIADRGHPRVFARDR